MGVLLFTAAPVEIADPISKFFHQSVGLKAITLDGISVKYQQHVLRQMNRVIVKTIITKAVKAAVSDSQNFRIVMSRQFSGENRQSLIQGDFTKVYSLVVSHYPDIVQQLEAESVAKFYNDPRFDRRGWPETGMPADIAGRYFLFLLTR